MMILGWGFFRVPKESSAFGRLIPRPFRSWWECSHPALPVACACGNGRLSWDCSRARTRKMLRLYLCLHLISSQGREEQKESGTSKK